MNLLKKCKIYSIRIAIQHISSDPFSNSKIEKTKEGIENKKVRRAIYQTNKP